MEFRKRTVTIVKDGSLHRYFSCLLVFLACCFSTIKCQGVDTHGPPKVEKNPIYLESFVPAGMQMIAHITDLLKYEPTVPVTTTAPTIATPPHKPGIFAPIAPPGVGLQKWPNRVTTTTKRPWWKLGETQNQGYFSRYKNGWSYTISSPIENNKERLLTQDEPEPQDDSNDLDLLGSLPIDLYKRINTIPDFDDDADPFGQVQKFTDDYDDRAPPFLRKKRPPPTRAYVTLLSIYDNLNKEAKKLVLNKYSGYSRRTLEDLEKFAQSTSAYQLEKILSKIVERRDISDMQTIKKISTMVEDLQQDNSYINQALADIPPLHYDIHF